MRNSGVIAVVAVLFAGSSLFAQGLSGAKAKKGEDQVTFDTVVRVNGTDLPSGTYEITSNGTQVTFRHLVESSEGEGHYDFDVKEKPLTVNCTGRVLPQKAENTDLDMPADANGVHVLHKLVLRDSDVECTLGS